MQRSSSNQLNFLEGCQKSQPVTDATVSFSNMIAYAPSSHRLATRPRIRFRSKVVPDALIRTLTADPRSCRDLIMSARTTLGDGLNRTTAAPFATLSSLAFSKVAPAAGRAWTRAPYR